MTDTEISTGELERLFGCTRKHVADLGRKGVIEQAGRGRWQRDASITGYYIKHLRVEALGRWAGATAREQLTAAQATLAQVKAKQLAGELVPADEIEKLWISRMFRNRILAVPSRFRDLSARQRMLTTELRACLDELADDQGRLMLGGAPSRRCDRRRSNLSACGSKPIFACRQGLQRRAGRSGYGRHRRA